MYLLFFRICQDIKGYCFYSHPYEKKGHMPAVNTRVNFLSNQLLCINKSLFCNNIFGMTYYTQITSNTRWSRDCISVTKVVSFHSLMNII